MYYNPDDKTMSIVDDKGLFYEPNKKGGWAILGQPPDYDGTDCNQLEEVQINKDILIWMIKHTEQSEASHVQIIRKNRDKDEWLLPKFVAVLVLIDLII